MKNKIRVQGLAFGLLAASLLLLSACEKEASYPYKVAGTWNVKRIQRSIYTDQGKKPTAMASWENKGTVQLYNLTDNYFNNAEQLITFDWKDSVPRSIEQFCNRALIQNPKKFDCNYVAGPHGNERLTFWKKMDILHELVMFTVTELRRNTMQLTYTETDNAGFLVYKEVWDCEIVE